MPEHRLVECDQCGQLDDHPMAHFGGEAGRSVHHDCMSKSERAMASPEVLSIISMAEAGMHGDELRQYIIGTDGGTL